MNGSDRKAKPGYVMISKVPEVLRLAVGAVGLAWLLAGTCGMSAAEWYVSPDGDDAQIGNADLPWRTISRAVQAAQAGDTVHVGAGYYSERVSTVRNGAPDARIRFRGEGAVVMHGWIINHSYITIENFEITRHSGASQLDAYVRVNNDGDFFEMIGCTVRDGIHVVIPDAWFFAADGCISNHAVNFVARGFSAGQTLYIGKATGTQSSINNGSYTIVMAEPSRLLLQPGVQDEGPVPVYLSASMVFGLYLSTRSEGCIIRSNVFRNLGYDSLLITGLGHLIEDNWIEATSGWDAMHFGGTNHVFRRNVIRNSPLVVFQNSPDAMENYQVPYRDVTFSNNMVINFAGVLASQKAPYTMSGLSLIRNVFVDVGRFNFTQRDTLVENNTFVRVAKKSYPNVARSSHPISVDTTVGATNVVIRNNIFVDCGEPSGGVSVSQVGWYEVKGDQGPLVMEGNFVAGGPPDYGPKAGWPESMMLNGGDPGFVNPEDPLGPDGLPFTADDGLRLRADSKLLGAGVGGVTIGAYELPFVERVPLVIERGGDGKVVLRWPRSMWEWRVETARNLAGPWTPLDLLQVEKGAFVEAEAAVSGEFEWFRLAR